MFDKALEESRYDDCRAMLAVREGLNIFSYFQFARVSECEGAFYSQQSRHEQAEQEYREAIYCYQRDLENSPEDTATLNNLGNALQRLGDLQSSLSQSQEALASYENAIASYDTALSLAPNYIQVHNNLGRTLINLANLYVNLSQPERAGECFNYAVNILSRSLEIAPNNASIRSLRDNLIAWLQSE